MSRSATRPLSLVLRVHRGIAAVTLFICLPATATAATVDFVRDVRPIFEKHCYACHSARKQKSGFRLDIKSEAFKGGDAYGPSIIPHKPQESPLVTFVSEDDPDARMPPEGAKLSAAEIATLTSWVAAGAVWPEGVDLAKLDDRRDHWSFKPATTPQPPRTKNTVWPRGAIDQFILARLEQEGLQPAPAADRVAWLRRVSFDLSGLPPTPEQVDAFIQDQRSDAYERVIDRLLESPRYGERWAQHWLDVVRYADTHGFEVNTERPNAWPYRDYVITALNSDTPYDQFIREQLVGDALGKDAATGFLITASVLLPGQIGKDEPSKRLARQDAVDEIVVNIGQTFLGLSIGCARCHDHKFDPISARDYYSMQAFVAGVEYADRELHTPEAIAARKEAQKLKAQVAEVDKQLARHSPLAKAGLERAMVSARENTDRFEFVKARRVRFTIQQTNNLEPCIDELEVFEIDGNNIALVSEGATVTASGSIIVADRHDLKHLNDGLYGNSRSWMSDEKGRGWVIVEFPAERTIDRVVWGRDREGKFTDRLATSYTIEIADDSGVWQAVADSSDRRKYDPKDKRPMAISTKGLDKVEAAQVEALIQEKGRLDARIKAADNARKVFAGIFRTPDTIHLLNRGDPEQPNEVVAPAVLSALGDLKLPKNTAEQSRRRALADWIANPDNPLTARVMINRLWQGHFGVGLVETASDFGRTGTKPSHPDLLDWLAQEFVRSGWSIKHMHRLIVLSATYRQSTESNPLATDKDVDARLLWRFPPRRLEAESLRDSMLAVSGQLNLKMGGRGFNSFDQRGGLSGFTPVESFRGDGLRRMIYAHKVRREREAVFGAFDCPDAGQSTARRRESTTPIQALNLFNSRFTLDQCDAFAARIKGESGESVAQQVRRAFQLALSRLPTSDETADAESVVEAFGLVTLCRALFNSNEFVFLP
jgi:mono/diheme cytochrome c family protein